MKSLHKQNVPWVEKYRPDKLSELSSQDSIVDSVEKFIYNKNIPHLLFYGPPGCGKTSTALVIASLLFKPAVYNSMVLELNASDDRGIDVVREQIITFASTGSLFDKDMFKVIILDEADAMTNDAQNALKRVVEKYSFNVRFFFICNYLNNIIPAIQSRCTRFRFSPLRQAQVVDRLRHICIKEQVGFEEEALYTIYKLTQGDMRKSINLLQSGHLIDSESKLTSEVIYSCTGLPSDTDVFGLLEKVRETYLGVDEKIALFRRLIAERSYSLSDVLAEVHSYIIERLEVLSVGNLPALLAGFAELQARLAETNNETLHLPFFVLQLVQFY